MLALVFEFNSKGFGIVSYRDALIDAMDFLASVPNTLFLGQSVAVEGTAMRGTLTNVPEKKLLELPVEEDFQMGLSTGLALSGYLPISIYPRWNFLLLATNQIVNHLDKIQMMSGGEYSPKVIIRTGIGSIDPFNPGPQHVGDFTDAMKLMCSSINVVRLDAADMVVPEYQKAALRDDGISTLLIEWSDKYYE
jgi:pyruvate/2-oxoglutarate/acetoin dehydrogenase E1 component